MKLPPSASAASVSTAPRAHSTSRLERHDRPAVLAVAGLAAALASLGLIGADALWLIPLGREVAHGHLPGSIPWATAPTAGWHDVPALGQLLFWGAWHAFGGYRGLLVAQVVAAAVGFWALARGLVREAPAGTVVTVSAIVLVGSASAVVVVGVALYSLALFPVLLLLLERESSEPSRLIWLSAPLLAVWGNLHGEVLAGFGLLACYLVLDRGRREPGVALGALAAATVALFLNPVLWQTPDYYRGVLENEAARKGLGLWAPLGFGGVDLLVIVAAAVLLALAALAFGRVRLWEAVAVAGLLVATIHVARTGTWLLFVAAYPAARAFRLGFPERVLRIGAIVFAATALVLLVRGPGDPGSRGVAAAAAASGRPVLAEGVLGQQVALAGGRVWVGNPIDAFPGADQSLYLDWLDGKPAGAAAIPHAAYVLVNPRSKAGLAAGRDPRLAPVLRTPAATLYRRR